MQIKIACNKLSVLKRSLSSIERVHFEKNNFNTELSGLEVKETAYTYELTGKKDKLFDFLDCMSFQFDIELV